MAEIRRLSADERFRVCLEFENRRVRVGTVSTTGARTEFDGWVRSVLTLRSGTTTEVLVLRTDLTRKDKDMGISLAQITTITRLDQDGQPTKEGAQP